MLGTIVNTAAILTGSTLGGCLKKGISDRRKTALFDAMGLAVCALGIHNICKFMPQSDYPVLFLVSLAAGALIGSCLNLSDRFDRLIARFSGSGNLAEGISTAVLLFCIGTLSILGPIESALHHDNTFLFTNSVLDFITSAVLASTYGFGIAAAAGVLFCWQGSLFLLAKLAGPFLSTALLCEVSILGGILIFSSGLSILGIKKIKTLDLLPALLIPPAALFLLGLFGI